jgi:CHAT domain-containing protein/Flp pilus assembly protein TadD
MARPLFRAMCALVLASPLLAADPNPAQPKNSLPVGVVVEEVEKGSAADKAGIKPGDALLYWQRAPNPPANPEPAHGDLRSPFDVREVEIEQAPRGTTSLMGLRGSQGLSAHMSPGKWSLIARPRFSLQTLNRYTEGKNLIEGGTLDRGSEVWRALAQALSTSGDHKSAAWLLMRLSLLESAAGRTDQATALLDQALADARAAQRPDIESQLWIQLADVLSTADRQEESAQAARHALSIRERDAPDSLAAADALCKLAFPMAWLDPEGARLERRALEIRTRLAPESLATAASLNNVANSADVHGDSRTAAELFRRSLAISERLEPDTNGLAEILQNVCGNDDERGDLASAEANCRRSITVRERLGREDLGLAASLHNAAIVARHQGNLDRAEQLQVRANAIRQRIAPVSRDTGWGLSELGVIEMDRGDLDRAETLFRQAEQILSAKAPKDSPHSATTLYNLAEINYLRENLEQAEANLRQALVFYEERAPGSLEAALYLNELGTVVAKVGRSAQAEGYFDQALAIRERVAPYSYVTAESHHSLGMLLWKAGRVGDAEAHLRRALDILDVQTGKLGGSEETRAGFDAKYSDYYRDYIELLMQLRRYKDAFHFLERSRARSLLMMLAERDIVFEADIPTDLEEERRLTDFEYETVQGQIRKLSPTKDAKAIDEALGRLGEIRQKQELVAKKIRALSPKYAALRYPEHLDLAETQGALDSGTLLISFSVGKEKSFLFVVSADPKRGPPLSVFTLPVGEKALRDSVQAFRTLIEWNKSSPELFSRSRSLYDILLKPAEALIAKADRLLLLPDGPLHSLPWAALVRDVKAGQAQYLVEWKPIHTAASATVYAELRKSRRENRQPPTFEVAAFGDPKYPSLARPAPVARRGDGTDEAAEAPEDLDQEPNVRAVMRGGYRLDPLPRSREEVQSITALYAPRAEAFLGENATEERAKSLGKDIPLIHFACHAILNERFPLDSALVLTIPEHPKEGQENGLLQAWEIFEKVRIDADLVTLSACDSGLGKEMGGEGLIGLTRAFQYAGARSVLASLWKVEDQSTAELMRRFYQYLKAGTTKDEALRLAQIDLIHSPAFSSPKDWASFELIGDWK